MTMCRLKEMPKLLDTPCFVCVFDSILLMRKNNNSIHEDKYVCLAYTRVERPTIEQILGQKTHKSFFYESS